MLYLTCTMRSSVDLALCGVSHAKDWVFVDCGTNSYVLVRIFMCPCKEYITVKTTGSN